MKRKTISLVVIFALALFAQGQALANDIDLSDSRYGYNSNQIIAAGLWSDPGVVVSWDIALEGDHYNYKYTFTGGSVGDNLSNITIEVSTNFSFYGTTPTAIDQDYFKDKFIGWPEGVEIYGVKFDVQGGSGFTKVNDNEITLTFNSQNVPVWGSFFMKDGTPAPYAYNKEFGNTPANGTTNFDGWIAVPDTTKVPLPGAVLLLGAGMARLMAYSRRRQD